MRILVGSVIPEFADYDSERFDVHFVAQDAGKAPLTIAEMIRRCPEGWIPDAYLHPSLGHFPLPVDIEEFEGLLASYVGDWDRRGRAIATGCIFFDLVAGERNACTRLNAIGYDNAHFARLCGANPKVHRLLPDIERDIDILFIGSLNSAIWSERNRWVDRIAQLSDRHNVVATYGHFGEDYVRLTNRAKIVFNRSVNGITNPRAYDSMLCGALVFNEAENSETREIFEDRVHCVYYNDENLEELLDYYLTHEDERQKIVEAGAALVLEKHTDGEHANALFGILESQMQVRYRPAAEISEAERAYKKALHYYGCLNPSPEASDQAMRWLDEAEALGYDRGRVMEGRAALMGWLADIVQGEERIEPIRNGVEYGKIAVESDGEDPFALLTAAMLQFENYKIQANTGEEAMTLMPGVIRLVERAAKACHTLIENTPDNSDSHCLGFGYPCLGDNFEFRYGVTLFHEEMNSEDCLKARASVLAWRCHTILHDLLASMRRASKAISHAAEAARCLPDDPMAWLRVARRETEAGFMEEAGIHYNEFFKLAPLEYSVWVEIAQYLKQHVGLDVAQEFVEERLRVVKAIPNFSPMELELRNAI